MNLTWLRDVLLFRELIAPQVLIAVYYLGAVGIPVVVVDLSRRIRRRLRRENPASEAVRKHGKRWLAELPAPWSFVRSRTFLASAALTLFVLAELCWRIIFEFFIAYFQMRDALMDM